MQSIAISIQTKKSNVRIWIALDIFMSLISQKHEFRPRVSTIIVS